MVALLYKRALCILSSVESILCPDPGEHGTCICVATDETGAHDRTRCLGNLVGNSARFVSIDGNNCVVYWRE